LIELGNALFAFIQRNDQRLIPARKTQVQFDQSMLNRQALFLLVLVQLQLDSPAFRENKKLTLLVGKFVYGMAQV
jgi:hypothetical protein